jgi:hypothetical protein
MVARKVLELSDDDDVVIISRSLLIYFVHIMTANTFMLLRWVRLTRRKIEFLHTAPNAKFLQVCFSTPMNAGVVGENKCDWMDLRERARLYISGWAV